MRYTVEIVIDAPRDRVVELFTDRARFTEWQPGLERYELISGSQAQTGARAELTTRLGGGTMEMTETIESNSLPDGLGVIYETEGIWNRNLNRFIAESPDRTRWVSDNEFRFEGARKALEFVPGAFKKETHLIMERFKAFVERGGSS